MSFSEDFDDIELSSVEIFNDNGDCPICYQKLENFVKLKCNHNFCLECYSGFIKNKINKCSICREEIKEIEYTMSIFQDYSDPNSLLISTHHLNNNYKILKIKYKLLLFILYIWVFVYFYHIQKNHTIEKKINKEEQNFLRLSYLMD